MSKKICKRLLSYLLVLCFLVFSSCSSVDKTTLKESNILPPAKGWSQPATQAARPATARRIDLPMDVAVHLSEPDDSRFHWTARERGKMASWGRELKAKRITNQFFLMSKLVSTGNSLDEIRRAAKLHGADVVLVIKSSGELEESWNPLAIFYLTILGYYIFPGSSAEAMLVANAVVLDVESGVPLFSIEAQGSKSSLSPGGWLDSQEVVRKASAKARSALGKEFTAGMYELANKLRTAAVKSRAVKKRMKKKRRVRQHRLPKPKPTLPKVIYR